MAKDLRARLVAKLATQTYSFVERVTPAKLLTNLTSDVDGVKLFVSMAIATIISSIFLIAGSSVLLLSINWRLGLGVLAIVPFIGITFYLALKKVRELFKKGQEAIDWLNRVINESILGATLIRLLNSQQMEYQKFVSANAEAKNVGLNILAVMSALIPTITLAANAATVMILLVGGRFVIAGRMSLGDFSAFNTYLALLIFPIIMLGFMSNIMAQAGASYMRLSAVLMAAPPPKAGENRSALRGDVAMSGVTLTLGDKQVLRDVSFSAKAGSMTAIIGPTAAGKTQMLYVLIGLLKPESGNVTYDDEPLEAYDKEALHRQVGFVFQDSILFNLTLRENIAFSTAIPEQDMEKAIATAELQDFIATLPAGPGYGGFRARNQPLRRSETTRHAGAGAGAQSQSPAARRLHGARGCQHRAGHSPEYSAELSRHHADLGDAENRFGGALRPDHPADGRRGAGHGNARAPDGDVAGIRPDLRIAAEHKSL